MTTKKSSKAKPTIHTRCRALNTAIREGVSVEANIKGTPRILTGILSNALGVTVLFRDEQNATVLFSVNPAAHLEFVVKVPRARGGTPLMTMQLDKPPAQSIQSPTQAPTLTRDDLWAAYRLGVTNGFHRHYQPPRLEMPTCPTHKDVPLWLEPHATPDGSWLYCPFCRADGKVKQTDALRKVQPHKVHLEKEE